MIRFALRVLAAFGALVLVVTLTPFTGWWAHALAGPFQAPPEGIPLVVLGGASSADHLLGEGSYLRALYAVRFAHESCTTSLIFCGRGAAVDMAALVRALGSPVSIGTEDKSSSTRENALFARPLIHGPVALVTSDYHMYRALRVFRKAGIDCTAVPAPDAMKRSAHWSGRWPAFLDLAEEMAKIAWYKVRGWM